ncbi:helix-turn-helix domain-containing protein [Paenibacillus macerans]|uniref:helix-turn-helix domain-containing protein n=1 Tax=Paenibacillus macerans TaxID=44252 RepID=UPI003D317636
MNEPTTILAEINEYMKRRELTLTQLAKEAEINPGTLSSILKGNRILTVEQLDRITELMGGPKGHYYEAYLQEHLQEINPDWRRVYPLLNSCAELNKLDCFRKGIDLLLDNLFYAPLLFDLAEELFRKGKYEAAEILYENVALSERRQHSERLALCQYRLFTIRLGSNQFQNVVLAYQFEPFVERLNEIDQLDALKDLANIHRALHNWDKVEELTGMLRSKGEIQYHLAHRSNNKKNDSPSPGRPLFFYCAYADLLHASASEAKKDYLVALQYTYNYANLDWVIETDDDTQQWVQLFKGWAQANTYAYTILSGDAGILPKYIEYINANQDEILPALFNIIEAANRYDFDVDDILQRFDTHISDYIEQQHTIGFYTNQLIANAFTEILHEIACYYFGRYQFALGFKYALHCLDFSFNLNKSGCILKSKAGLFEHHRDKASSEMKSAFQNLMDEKGKAVTMIGV